MLLLSRRVGTKPSAASSKLAACKTLAIPASLPEPQPSAYFFGKDLIQVPRLALLTVTFAVPFYTLTTPSPSLTYYWIVLVLVAYVVSGYSYIE